jgi:hypothetical protein
VIGVAPTSRANATLNQLSFGYEVNGKRVVMKNKLATLGRPRVRVRAIRVSVRAATGT